MWAGGTPPKAGDLGVREIPASAPPPPHQWAPKGSHMLTGLVAVPVWGPPTSTGPLGAQPGRLQRRLAKHNSSVECLNPG